MAGITGTALEGLKAVAYFVAWPGLLGVSAFVLLRAARFHRQVNRQPAGRLVLLMVVASVMTWGALAAFATFDLGERDQSAAIVLPLFLLWGGSMVLITWIMHRWGAEAVRLNIYHSELAHMDQMKAQLINTVAHDINTPLTPIRFRLATMRAGGFGAVSGRQVEALQSIDRNLDRVDAIVGTMVLAVQLQTKKVQLDLRPVPLGPFAAEVAGRLAAVAAEKGVELRVEADAAPTVQADPKRLGVAVEALVSNGVKFTPAPGGVTVRVAAAGLDVAIEVEDTGIGLTPEAQASLFQPLRQEHGTLLTETGTGLGLYIAQAIARLHGGRVTVESPGLGRGSRFRMTIPRGP
ncbi:MAG: HAMP domain-containing histidine kinase [Halobacteriales archaeon]|nr:HAMP domain-containing histidine kinase [Halobacteriales archaeon]